MNDRPMTEREIAGRCVSKVPAVTLGFWIIKILATTLGETGGDSVTMSWLGETTAHPVPNGYLIGTAIFGVLLVGLVWAQIRARNFNPWLYWATIVASTTAGTTLADFATRSLGIGYPGGSILLLSLVLISLFAWHRALGTIDVNTVATAKAESFYWVTITFSQTLGTALGDWVADAGLGYSGGAVVFGAALGGARDPLFLKPHHPRCTVLGGVHPDPPAWRDGRRLARQAACQWRARVQPAARLGSARGGDHRFDPVAPTAPGAAPWQGPSDGLSSPLVDDRLARRQPRC